MSDSEYEKKIEAINSVWSAQIAKEKIEYAEKIERMRIVRDLLSIDGLTIVPLDGIGPNTAVVSQEMYDLLKEVMKNPWMMNPDEDEFVRLRMLRRKHL